MTRRPRAHPHFDMAFNQPPWPGPGSGTTWAADTTHPPRLDLILTPHRSHPPRGPTTLRWPYTCVDVLAHAVFEDAQLHRALGRSCDAAVWVRTRTKNAAASSTALSSVNRRPRSSRWPALAGARRGERTTTTSGPNAATQSPRNDAMNAEVAGQPTLGTIASTDDARSQHPTLIQRHAHGLRHEYTSTNVDTYIHLDLVVYIYMYTSM